MLVGLRSIGVAAHSVTSSPSGTRKSSSGTCVAPAVWTGAGGRGGPPAGAAGCCGADACWARPPTASAPASRSPATYCVGAGGGTLHGRAFWATANSTASAAIRTRECVSSREVPCPARFEIEGAAPRGAWGHDLHRRNLRDHGTRAGAGIDRSRHDPAVHQRLKQFCGGVTGGRAERRIWTAYIARYTTPCWYKAVLSREGKEDIPILESGRRGGHTLQEVGRQDISHVT